MDGAADVAAHLPRCRQAHGQGRGVDLLLHRRGLHYAKTQINVRIKAGRTAPAPAATTTPPPAAQRQSVEVAFCVDSASSCAKRSKPESPEGAPSVRTSATQDRTGKSPTSDSLAGVQGVRRDGGGRSASEQFTARALGTRTAALTLALSVLPHGAPPRRNQWLTARAPHERRRAAATHRYLRRRANPVLRIRRQGRHPATLPPPTSTGRRLPAGTPPTSAPRTSRRRCPRHRFEEHARHGRNSRLGHRRGGAPLRGRLRLDRHPRLQGLQRREGR